MMREHELPTSVLLRAGADGELSPEGQARLEEHLRAHPDDRARLRFEQQLRGAVGRAMRAGETLAPAGLRDRVLARVHASPADPHAPVAPTMLLTDHAPRPRVRTLGIALRVAAAIALVAGLGYLASRSGPGSVARDGLPVITADLGVAAWSKAADFVSGEHERCAGSPEALQRKLKIGPAADVPAQIESLVGRPLGVAEMERAGFEFLGAGPCHVPGPGASVHLMFAPKPDTGPADRPASSKVSLFVQKDLGHLEMRSGVVYSIGAGWRATTPPASTGPHPNPRGTIFVWRSEGLIFYLVSGNAEACDTLRKSLNQAG
ncbi:MAG: hypothetical protein JNM07_11825 [Phycisphaerae bacterium]|nr:hypothetical protein [Phycisphaerae bacterium]